MPGGIRASWDPDLLCYLQAAGLWANDFTSLSSMPPGQNRVNKTPTVSCHEKANTEQEYATHGRDSVNGY